MAMTLADADHYLVECVAHIGYDGTFSVEKRHKAIRSACNRWLHDVPSSWTETNFALANGDSTINITTTLTDFVEDNWVSGEINSRDVGLVPYTTVRRRFDGATPTGQPTMIGFKMPSYGLFNVACSSAFTLKVTHHQLLTSFTPGTLVDVVLNIPASKSDDIIKWGGMMYLFWGLSGHEPYATAAREEFARIITEAGGRFPGIGKSDDQNTIRSRTVLDSTVVGTPKKG